MRFMVWLVGLVAAGCLAGCAASTAASDGAVPGEGPAPITVRHVAAVPIGRVEAELAPSANEGVVACAPITELARTEICVFPSRPTLVSSLGRAAFGIEKLRGKVIGHESLAKMAEGGAIGGIDLESSALATFRDAQQRASAALGAPNSEGARRAVAIESAFWDAYVVPVTLADPKRVLLGVPRLEEGGLDAQTLDHEYLHAQFFESAGLEAAVGRCFDALPEARRAAVLETLNDMGVYDTTEPRLVRNEYFAYTLTDGFVGVFALDGARSELESCLAKAGVSPTHAVK